MATSSATVTVTIKASVSAADDSFNTDAETAITFPIEDLLANDTVNGVPATLENATFQIVSQPANGTLVDNEDGTLTYTPNEGFCGLDPFEYEITAICQECAELVFVNGYISVEDVWAAVLGLDGVDQFSVEGPDESGTGTETYHFYLEYEGDTPSNYAPGEGGASYIPCAADGTGGWAGLTLQWEGGEACANISNSCA